MANDRPKLAYEIEVGDRLNFNYQKSPQYRTIHCDGAHGGITPRGYIAFTLYNERNVIPRTGSREVLSAETSGKFELGEERIDESLGGIMRQLETTIYMDFNTAREFYEWFGNKVHDLEEAYGVPEDQRIGKKRDD